MIVKVSKTFIKDLAKVKDLETINYAEFVIDFSNMCSDPGSQQQKTKTPLISDVSEGFIYLVQSVLKKLSGLIKLNFI